MFTPIKNLLTYIQKNASGSNFFGGTSSSTELNTAATMMDGEMVDTTSSTSPPPLTTDLTPMCDKNHDQNENEVLELVAGDTTISDDPLLIQDDEGEKDIFLDFPPDTETDDNDVDFAPSEVIVLEDPDLNASVLSDAGTDPLAIDDCNAHMVNSPNPLETSADGDVLYMVDIDEIESKAPQIRDDTEDTNVLADAKTTDEQEIRSDGSDSGLGSETSALQSTVTSVADMSTSSTASTSPIVEKTPLRSNLKRRLQEIGESDEQLQKKPRRSINFDGVKVFYFPRIQGHGCVPSQGGCTLGMGAHHISFKTFSLAEHAAELRRAHKLQLQEINPRGSSSEESDSDEELTEGSGSDLDAETNGFLQPVSPKQRRTLLKAAGVRKIDPNEKIECRDIRNSREVCGCVCRDFCDPETCACSQAGIKCQVDRAMFPCGCSRDACGNVIGRIEFNPSRVRTHYIHTIMRLDMENRQAKRTHEHAASTSLMVYNTNPALTNSTTAINSYNTIPNYVMEQNSTAVAHVYHHHMHQQQPQQHSAYINHMPPVHPVGSVYAGLIDTPALPLPLPQPHSHYVNTTVTEPDSIASNLAMSSAHLHYHDGSIYPAVQPSPLPQPPAAVYGDILAPYASSTPYQSAPVVESSFSVPYTSYHSSHLIQNHLQPQQPFLGYTTACSGDANVYNEPQSSFISLNTPEASSSRLSAINDLLHNNRNTTAALVAVPPDSAQVTPPDEASAIEVDQGQEALTLITDANEGSDAEEAFEKTPIETHGECKENVVEIDQENTPSESTDKPTLEPVQDKAQPLPPSPESMPSTNGDTSNCSSENEPNHTTPNDTTTDSIIKDVPPISTVKPEEDPTTESLPPIIEAVST